MKLSVVMPCFNEIRTVEKILRKVVLAPVPKEIKEIELIVIDDRSTDGTIDLLNKIASDPRKHIGLQDNQKFILLHQEQNGGKGRALRAGFAKSSGQIILVQDADLEYDPQDYFRLLSPITEGFADVVFGSRFIGTERRVLYFNHSIVNKMLTFFSNLLTNINLTDMETCYKVFDAKLLKSIKLESNRFGFEPEVTAKVAKLKPRIYEIGIRYHGRTYEEGKKITWKDGIAALWFIVKYNLFR